MPISQTAIFSGRISNSHSAHGSILRKYPIVPQLFCLYFWQIIQQPLSSWFYYGKTSNSSTALLSLFLVDYLTAPQLVVQFWENIQQFSRSFVFTSSTVDYPTVPQLMVQFWEIIQQFSRSLVFFLVQIIQQSQSSWFYSRKIANSSRDLLSLFLVDYPIVPQFMVLLQENIQQFSSSFVFTFGRLSNKPLSSWFYSGKISNSSPDILSLLLVDYPTTPRLMVLFLENIQQFSRSFVFTSGR